MATGTTWSREGAIGLALSEWRKGQHPGLKVRAICDKVMRRIGLGPLTEGERNTIDNMRLDA